MANNIKYRQGLKYQLVEDTIQILSFGPEHIVKHDYIKFYPNGELHIRKGYAWDGCSGIAIDTDDNMRGSLVHDAGYQLMREGILDHKYKDMFDSEFRDICLEDGMCKIRASLFFAGVSLFGDRYVERQKEIIYTAP